TNMPSSNRYNFGFGGGSSRAVTVSVKPIRLWLPSQKGLLAECPHRQSEMTVRPARPKAAPVGSQISNSPSMRILPLVLTVSLVGIPTNLPQGDHFFLGCGVANGGAAAGVSTTSPNLMVDLPSYFL